MPYQPTLDLYIPYADTVVELGGKQEWVIGVTKGCDLDLSTYFDGMRYRTISRRHLKWVHVADRGAVLFDLNSTNGTRLNGQRMVPQQAYVLSENDVVLLAENPTFTLEVIKRQRQVTEPLYPNRASRSGLETVIAPMRALYLDGDNHFVVDGVKLPYDYLTPLERGVLTYIYGRSGRVVSYDEIVQHVWGDDQRHHIQNNTVAKVVSNLRRKLNDVSDDAGNYYIRTVYGQGLTCQPL